MLLNYQNKDDTTRLMIEIKVLSIITMIMIMVNIMIVECIEGYDDDDCR